MPGLFAPMPNGAAVRLDETEISVLRRQAAQLLDLIGPAEEPAGGDAEQLVATAFADGPSHPPGDPVLARLFPDAYGDPDRPPDDGERAASAEYRRYTENDLRARKRDGALTIIRALDELTDRGDAVLHLKTEECHRWLGALNDLRLAIGTRLDITDEDDGDNLLRLPDSDPRKAMGVVYLWLGALQETLIDTL